MSCHTLYLHYALPVAPYTASSGASMTVERCTWATSASKLPLQGLEAALEDGAADAGGELGLAFDGAVEARRPLGEGAVAVGHRRQLQRGDVVLHAHRRFEDRIAAGEVIVGERKQLLADEAAVLKSKSSEANT